MQALPYVVVRQEMVAKVYEVCFAKILHCYEALTDGRTLSYIGMHLKGSHMENCQKSKDKNLKLCFVVV